MLADQAFRQEMDNPRVNGVTPHHVRFETELGDQVFGGRRVVLGHGSGGVLVQDFSLRRRWAVGRIALFGWFGRQTHVVTP